MLGTSASDSQLALAVREARPRVCGRKYLGAIDALVDAPHWRPPADTIKRPQPDYRPMDLRSGSAQLMSEILCRSVHVRMSNLLAGLCASRPTVLNPHDLRGNNERRGRSHATTTGYADMLRRAAYNQAGDGTGGQPGVRRLRRTAYVTVPARRST